MVSFCRACTASSAISVQMSSLPEGPVLRSPSLELSFYVTAPISKRRWCRLRAVRALPNSSGASKQMVAVGLQECDAMAQRRLGQ